MRDKNDATMSATKLLRSLLHLIISLGLFHNAIVSYIVSYSSDFFSLNYSLMCSSFDVCVDVIWRTWTRERGCDLRRRLPLSHYLRVVRRLVTMHAFFVAAPHVCMEHFVIQRHCVWDTRHLQASSENASSCHVIAFFPNGDTKTATNSFYLIYV